MAREVWSIVAVGGGHVLLAVWILGVVTVELRDVGVSRIICSGIQAAVLFGIMLLIHPTRGGQVCVGTRG